MLEHADQTPISKLGEFGLIERLQKVFPTDGLTLNDDCAVMGTGDKRTLYSKDLLLEGVHFDLTYVPPKHLGYKSVAVNLSDIAAMNGHPRYIMLGLGIPANFALDAFDDLIEGISLACNEYDVKLIGGDTSNSPRGLQISITVIGEAAADEVVLRSGASANELICITGSVGSACAGFLVLDREQKLFRQNPNIQPDLEPHAIVVERQLKPEPRFDVLYQLKQNQLKPTAMIDISDGLAPDLLHLCKASGVGCRIDAARIPIDQGVYTVAEEMHLDAHQLALYGGEDYELLFTIPATYYEQIQLIPEVKIIGFTTDQPGYCHVVDDKNQLHPLLMQGWDSIGGTGAANI